MLCDIVVLYVFREREIAEATRKERERIEQIKSAKNAAKRGHENNMYMFEMLCTDDSTDDESSARTKRGNPPTWCLCKSINYTFRGKHAQINIFLIANIL